MPKFVVEARKWAKANGLRGPQAFLKYVVFTFIELLNSVSDDFVFKGGTSFGFISKRLGPPLIWTFLH